MQLILDLTSQEQLVKCWAFAKDYGFRTVQKNRRTFKSLNRCVITACSKEAKALGVRVGMQYEDAKLLIPGLRVNICNWR